MFVLRPKIHYFTLCADYFPSRTLEIRCVSVQFFFFFGVADDLLTPYFPNVFVSFNSSIKLILCWFWPCSAFYFSSASPALCNVKCFSWIGNDLSAVRFPCLHIHGAHHATISYPLSPLCIKIFFNCLLLAVCILDLWRIKIQCWKWPLVLEVQIWVSWLQKTKIDLCFSPFLSL